MLSAIIAMYLSFNPHPQPYCSLACQRLNYNIHVEHWGRGHK